MVIVHDPSLFFILLVEEVFISLVLSIKSMVSISGWLSPHSLEMVSISPLQAYSFRCWFSNNSVLTFLEGCFPSSFVAEVVIFFSIPLFQGSIFYYLLFPEALWYCSLRPIIFFFQDHVLSFAYPFNRGVVPAFQVLPILSSFAPLLNRSVVWNLSYPLCLPFNSFGGSVLLISSSIFSSCQVHVLFLPFSVGVLSKLYQSYSFSILF